MEKILIEEPNRFVLFPIKHQDIWQMYKTHQAAFWTAEEIDLAQDLTDRMSSILLNTCWHSLLHLTESSTKI